MYKFVVYQGTRGQGGNLTNMTVHTPAYSKLRALLKQTNQSMVTLFDMMVDYCIEHLEVR